MQNIWLFWLILAAIMFIGEIVTAGFLLFWVGLGALVSLVLAIFGVPTVIQIVVFLIVTALLIMFTKPIVDKTLKPTFTPTNVDKIIGKQGYVIKEINNVLGTGQVKVGHEVWTAESEDNENIPQDSYVTVSKVNGVKVVVKLSQKEKIKEE